MREEGAIQVAKQRRSLAVGGGSAINSYDCDSGRVAGATEGRQNRVGSPHIEKKRNWLTRYLKSYPRLGEGDGGPRVQALSVVV